jgi:predicted ATPase
MRIKKIQALDFKRFTNLTVSDMPESVRLVMLAGPNGTGKSSLFEAMHTWHQNTWRDHNFWDTSYHAKSPTGTRVWQGDIEIEFYGEIPQTRIEKRKAIYIRSAYRNDSDFNIDRLKRLNTIIEEQRLTRLIDNDASVRRNYERMASQGLEDVYEREDEAVTIGEFRERTIGDVKRALLRLFPELELNSLGNPLSEGTFKFTKGVASGFAFKNLSGGEKAAFDLILDLIVTRREYDNTVFCIDEPEAHMNARLHGELLSVLFDLLPEKCQLWLASHSIGMMRRARDLEAAKPGTVAFLDFEERDFDKPQTLTPVRPNRAFWQRAYAIALDDLASLVAPSRVVVCEGTPTAASANRNAQLDSECYNRIFEAEFPETRFLPGGNRSDVESDRLALIQSIQALVSGTEVIRLIDRDDHSPEDIAERLAQGVRVLSRRTVESYLFDDEVLEALCASLDKTEKLSALLAQRRAAIQRSVERGNPVDDIASASGEIYIAAKRLLQITGGGNDARKFMRFTLSPLIKPGMRVYEQLKTDIFGSVG